MKSIKVTETLDCLSTKHRFIVDTSFDRPVTSQYAKLYIGSAVDSLTASQDTSSTGNETT